MDSGDRLSVFERVGGAAWFVALVDRFYAGVEGDATLRPLYPSDLEPGKHHLSLFLAQYWGGPSDYQSLRGHPRLRQRHFPFPIGPRERDAWLHHMTAAVRAGGADAASEAELLAYFQMAANSLVNK
ncbi:MAG: globin [Candidatus Dormibacteria bacterium]